MITTIQTMTQGKMTHSWRQVFLKMVGRCPHWALSFPLTIGQETFRACVACGARRKFNLETWREEGGYYFPAKDERENTSGHTDISQ